MRGMRTDQAGREPDDQQHQGLAHEVATLTVTFRIGMIGIDQPLPGGDSMGKRCRPFHRLLTQRKQTRRPRHRILPTIRFRAMTGFGGEEEGGAFSVMVEVTRKDTPP